MAVASHNLAPTTGAFPMEATLMEHLQWDAGHLEGRIMGLKSNHESLKALLDICYQQSRFLYGEDERGEDEITLVGLFRLGNFLLKNLDTNIKEVQAIADAGYRKNWEQRTVVKEEE
jgi:hypothetical protein